jgi:hypothetical protein
MIIVKEKEEPRRLDDKRARTGRTQLEKQENNENGNTTGNNCNKLMRITSTHSMSSDGF